jgi:hypothetical protein
MSLKASFTAVVLTACLAWAHPGHEKVYQHAPEVRDLGHCDKAFSHPEFVKRTVERHGDELHRLRRAVGLEADQGYVTPRDILKSTRSRREC